MIFQFENSNHYNSFLLFISVFFVDSFFFFSQKHQLCIYWLSFQCLSNLLSLQKFYVVCTHFICQIFSYLSIPLTLFSVKFFYLCHFQRVFFLLYFFISIFIFFLNSTRSIFSSFYLSYAVFPKLCFSLNSFLENISLVICFSQLFCFSSPYVKKNMAALMSGSIHWSLSNHYPSLMRLEGGSTTGRGRERGMKRLEISQGSSQPLFQLTDSNAFLYKFFPNLLFSQHQKYFTSWSLDSSLSPTSSTFFSDRLPGLRNQMVENRMTWLADCPFEASSPPILECQLGSLQEFLQFSYASQKPSSL